MQEEIFDEKMLRQYMKRQISGKNSIIAGLTHKFACSHREIYSMIHSNFIKGALGQDHSYSVLNRLYRDIELNKTKKFTVYNYFDLDTLIAYQSYLQYIVDEMDNNKIKNGRRYPIREDFLNAIKSAPNWLKDNQNTETTGYYDYYNPVSFLEDSGYLRPEKTMSQVDFEKKYNMADAEDKLYKYLDAKHKKPVVKEIAEEDPVFEKEAKLEGEQLTYDSQEYNIIRQDIYYDRDCFPIRNIYAYCREGRDTLIGTFDLSGKVYYGELYNSEGGIELGKEFSGVQIIHKKTYDDPGSKTKKPLHAGELYSIDGRVCEQVQLPLDKHYSPDEM